MDNQDIRWVQRFSNYQKALKQLNNGLTIMNTKGLSELEKQGLIQAFEFTHELSWKVLKDFLQYKGATDLFGSRDVVRRAFSLGLIEDGNVWMKMIESRNMTSHTYNEDTVNEIINLIEGEYALKFNELESVLIKLIEED